MFVCLPLLQFLSANFIYTVTAFQSVCNLNSRSFSYTSDYEVFNFVKCFTIHYMKCQWQDYYRFFDSSRHSKLINFNLKDVVTSDSYVSIAA